MVTWRFSDTYNRRCWMVTEVKRSSGDSTWLLSVLVEEECQSACRWCSNILATMPAKILCAVCLEWVEIEDIQWYWRPPRASDIDGRIQSYPTSSCVYRHPPWYRSFTYLHYRTCTGADRHFLLRVGGWTFSQNNWEPKYLIYLKLGYFWSPTRDFWHWKTPFLESFTSVYKARVVR